MKDSLAATLASAPVPKKRAAPATISQALDVVLERTRRGDEELAQARLGLGAARRALLSTIDGQRTLAEAAPGRTDQDQLAADAARLVAFGLVRQVRHELPRRFMLAAMNLTLHVPRAAVLPAAVADSQSERAPSSSFSVGGRLTIALLGIVLFAVAVGAWLMR